MDIEQPSATAPQLPARAESVPPDRRAAARIWLPRLLLLLILLVGAYFRTLSLPDWDAGTGQHPDERFFTNVASTVRLPSGLGELYDSARSPLNPRSYEQFPLYVYGPFPISLTRAVAVALTPNDGPAGAILPEQVPSIAGPPRRGIDGTDQVRTDYGPPVANPERAFLKLTPLIPLLNPEGRNLTGYGEIVKVGRWLAALCDLGSILLVALIGRRLFGRRVGLLAALLAALAVMPIQQSHFFVDPIFSTFFCLLALYWAVRVAQGGGWLSYAALGLSIGAAMANRITMATLGLVAIVAAGLAAWQWAQDARRRTPDEGRPTTDAEQRSADEEQPTAADRQEARDSVSSAGAALFRVRFASFVDRFLTRDLPLLVLAGALTVLGFRTLAPDAFTGSNAASPIMVGARPLDIDALQGLGFFDIRPDPRFIDNLSTVQALVSGEYDFPPSQQWVGRSPYLFPWVNMVLWGMGPALGLAAWGGWALFGLGGLRRLLWPERTPAHTPGSLSGPMAAAWVLFVWAGFYFAWQGAQFAITMRYLLPIYGALILFAAWLLVRLWDWGQKTTAERRTLGEAGRVVRFSAFVLRPASFALLRWAVVGVLIATAAWAWAFSRIYTQPNARVMAAQWMAQHAPPGALIMAEIWDDPLPLQTTAAAWGSTYEGIQSAPYAEDDPRKYRDPAGVEGLIDQLDRADYITLTSNRIYDSTSRLRMRYPALMRYYHHLFNGELGFELAAEITAYPSLLGLRIPDQGAEEAFTVYDHQRVLIFAKTPAYSRQLAEQLIIEDVNWGEVYKSPVQVADRNPTALRLTDSQWPRYRDGGTWAALFSTGGLVSALAPLLWLAVIELLGLAAFALLFRMLPGLPDRGFSLAKIVGLLAVAYAAWLLGSLGNGTGIPGRGGATDLPLLPLPFAPATLWLCAAPLLLGGGLSAYRARAELRAFWQERRTALLSAEAIFLGFALLGLLLRWLNPDLWHPARGGEKPMDFAYLNAVLKSAAFPPYDPWHAGGYINYYYFGFVLVGTLIHLTTVAPSIGYNLAVSTLFGLTALGAWGVLYNLLAPHLTNAEESATKDQEATSSDQPPVPQAALPASALVLGPSSFGAEHRALLAAALAPALLLLLGNLAQAFWFLSGYAQQQNARPEWAFWDATRIVPGTVNEFPFFTFLFADLHAHMIVMPLSLALLGLALAFVRGPAPRGRPLPAACLLLMGLLAGAIRATNTWDYPTYVGLAALIVLVALFRGLRARGEPLVRAVAFSALGAALIPLIGNLLFQPFTANFATESSGVELLREGLQPTLLSQVLLAQRTTVWELIQLYGLWLAVATAGGLLLLWRIVGGSTAAAIGGALAILTLAGCVAGWPAPVLLVPMLGMALGLLWAMRRLPLRLLLPALWAAAGLGLLLLVEVLVVKGDVGRMNTVFKFGLHSWTLFALSAAATLPWIWRGDARPNSNGARRPTPATLLVRGGLVLLLVAAAVYPLTATPARVADRWAPEAPRSLDGAAFFAAISAERNGQPFSLDEDAAAIAWLQRTVAGTPVILEAHLPSYQWAGRVATYTGLPTILGWEWHQIQQRGAVGASEVIGNRQQVVSLIYNTPEPQTALDELRLYGVEYVYVGGVERATYEPTGIAKFSDMAARGYLEPVFSQGQTAIYRVVEPGQPRMLTSDLRLDPPSADTPPPLLLDTQVNQLPAVNEYAWNGLVRDSSWLSLLLWLATLYGLAALGLPVARLVFGRWHDGGLGLARLIGLLLLGYAVWLPTSLGLWRYDAWGMLGGLLLVLALDAMALWALRRRAPDDRLTTPDPRRQAGDDTAQPPAEAMPTERGGPLARGLGAISGSLREHRRAALIGEALFLAGFAAMSLIRALNPDLWHPTWGGEKPMEFGFLNAILRSPVMPPYDPFFSDGSINYYYYGLYLVSLPIKASGIDPAVGFNLAVATVFGLTLAGAYTLTAQVTRRARYGLVGALLIAVAGNLAGVFAVGWSGGLGAVRAALAGGLPGFGERIGDWYIGASRVIPQTINEFPFFTFLFADLHPHMIALPITLLAASLAYRIVERRRAPTDAERQRRADAGPTTASQRPTPAVLRSSAFGLPPAALALLALSLGALAVTNSWDFPTYALLSGLAMLGAAWRAGGPRARGVPWAALLRAGGAAALTALAGLALYAPFFDHYYAFVRGLGAVPLSGGTRIPDYLVVYGLPLAVLLPLALAALWRSSGPRATPERLGAVAPLGGLRPALNGRWLALSLALAALVTAALVPALGLRLALLALLLALVPILLRRGVGAPAWFALLLAWVAWAVSLGVELIYIRDHLDGGDWYRMNTVFKFGMQVWVLLGLAAAVALPALLRGLQRLGGASARATGIALLALLAAAAAVYPLAAVPSRVANRFDVATGLTLDGLAFLHQASFDYDCAAFGGCLPGAGSVTVDLSGDAAAIDWLNREMRGTPIVVQSNLWFYRAYGIRIAANTGLPTVISALHANEQRDPALTGQRDRDLEQFYKTTATEEALRFLAKYRVNYVYVGGVERAFYPAEGLAKFDLMRDTYLAAVYETPQVQIYQVLSIPDSYARPLPYDFGAAAPGPPAELPAVETAPDLAAIEAAVTADPTDGPLVFGLAERYRQAGRLTDAARVLEVAAQANPGDIGLHHLWGDILSEAGRYDEAEVAYLGAIRADPSAGNYNKLGSALLAWGRLDKAEIALTQAVQADPSIPDPYFELGKLFAAQGQIERALAELQTYLELDPTGAWSADARQLVAELTR